MPVAIFDMDGVLYRGSILLPHAKETVDRLRRAGWQVFFATNNSTATREDYVQRLTKLGLGGDAAHRDQRVRTRALPGALEPKPQDVYVGGAMVCVRRSARGIRCATRRRCGFRTSRVSAPMA